jgi:hypothetical protein
MTSGWGIFKHINYFTLGFFAVDTFIQAKTAQQ